MKLFNTLVLGISWVLVTAQSPLWAEDTHVLENFAGFQAGQTPKSGWRSRNGNPKHVYKVAHESDQSFLRAQDTGQSVQFFRRKGWDFSKHRYLHWDWRVVQFPKGAHELTSGKNDSALGLYVVFPTRFFQPETIKYIWSESVPAGTVISSKRYPKIIIRTGKENVGEWVHEVRDVKADYEKLFGRKAPDPVAFGFLTDANDTKSIAIGDYAKIYASDSMEPKGKKPIDSDKASDKPSTTDEAKVSR